MCEIGAAECVGMDPRTDKRPLGCSDGHRHHLARALARKAGDAAGALAARAYLRLALLGMCARSVGNSMAEHLEAVVQGKAHRRGNGTPDDDVL